MPERSTNVYRNDKRLDWLIKHQYQLLLMALLGFSSLLALLTGDQPQRAQAGATIKPALRFARADTQSARQSMMVSVNYRAAELHPHVSFAADAPVSTSTRTATSTRTSTATATPTQPVLLDADVAPTVTSPGGSLVLSYTVFSPSARQVSLGAGVRVSGTGGFTYDPVNDRTLNIVAGTSVVTRTFVLPTTGGVTYDVTWGLWSAGFVTEYGSQVRLNAVSVMGATPTPSAPTLASFGLAPTTAVRSSTVVFSYTVFTPYALDVGLGADVSVSGTVNFVGDPANDRVVSIIAGTTVLTRTFNLTDTLVAGPYWVRWGIWDHTFTNQYDIGRAHPGLYIVDAPPTPTPTLTPTLTTTPPTSTPTITITRTPTNTPTNTPTYTPSDTVTSTRTPTVTNTPSDSPSATDISTSTPTGIPAPTNTPTFTGTPPAATLVGHVTWQGRPAQPDALQQLPITLTLKLGTTEVNYPSQATDSSGFFTVSLGSLAGGTYTWRVKGPKYLANSGTVQVTGYRLKVGASELSTFNFQPATSTEMGLMKAGDCNNDNIISIQDFSILRSTFGRSVRDIGYDDRADFTGDQLVAIQDFNLLKGNFGVGGALVAACP